MHKPQPGYLVELRTSPLDWWDYLDNVARSTTANYWSSELAPSGSSCGTKAQAAPMRLS